MIKARLTLQHGRVERFITIEVTLTNFGVFHLKTVGIEIYQDRVPRMRRNTGRVIGLIGWIGQILYLSVDALPAVQNNIA